MPEIELLVPAGNWEKLKVAVAYGADGVYFGGPDFSLRRHAGNFTAGQLPEVVSYCRDHRVKSYLTVNCYVHPRELESLSAFLLSLRSHPPDALIVSDPGTINLCRELLPEIPLHLSTQANTTNQQAALFWHRLGIKRVNLARELSLNDIAIIHRAIPEMELEVFVHGAMCMAYSGRCLLSSVLTGRSANRGDCAQPCRWSYAVMEETRPGEYFPIEEDQRGAYLFNSRDLCLLEHLPALRAAGVSSVKIEGRMKSSYYVAVVTRVYRRMIDLLAREDGEVSMETMASLKNELTRVSHRGYTRGFIDGYPGLDIQNISDSLYIRNYQYVALVLEANLGEKSKPAPILLAVKDQISVGDKLLVMDPSDSDFIVTITRIFADNGKLLTCSHPGCQVWVDIDHGVLRPGQILHREIC
jgi:putative protease